MNGSNPPLLQTTAGKVLVGLGAVVTGLGMGIGAFVLVSDDGAGDTSGDEVAVAAATTIAAPTTTAATTTAVPTTAATTTAAPPLAPPTTRFPVPTTTRVRTATTISGGSSGGSSNWNGSERVQEYFDANSSRDADQFVNQWAYPIRRYYDVPNAGEDVVRARAELQWSRWSSLEYRLLGAARVAPRSSTEVVITQDYAFEWTGFNGEYRADDSTIQLVVRTGDLRIVEARDI